MIIQAQGKIQEDDNIQKLRDELFTELISPCVLSRVLGDNKASGRHGLNVT